MTKHLNIAIDGPAGAGKSTAARSVAKALGIHYLDTGAMYRAMALFVAERGAAFDDCAAIDAMLPEADVRVRYEADGSQRVLIGARDVTDLLRTPELSMGASKVSAYPPVRIKLSALQRRVGEEYDVVMDGRDITTNVLKDTPHKFFITASPEERARRRLLELREKGDNSATFSAVLADIERRDEQDSTRAFMPLVEAPDALKIDTTELTVEEVTDRMLAAIRGKA